MSSKPGESTLDAILAGTLNRDTYNADRKQLQGTVQEKAMEISSGIQGDSEADEGHLSNLRPPSDVEEYYLSDEVSDIEEIEDDSVVGIDSESDEDVHQIIDSDDVENIDSSSGDEVDEEEEDNPVLHISSSSEKVEETNADEEVESEESSESDEDEKPLAELKPISEEKPLVEEKSPSEEIPLLAPTENDNIPKLDENSIAEDVGAVSNDSHKEITSTETVDAVTEKDESVDAPVKHASYEDTINAVAQMDAAQLAVITARVEAGGTPDFKAKKKRVRKKKPSAEDGQMESSDGATPVKSKKKKAKNDGEDGSSPVKKKKKKKKADGDGQTTDGESPPKKKRRRKKKSESAEGDDDEEKKKKKLYERRNIRKIIKEDELDVETLAAQQEEEQRRKRVLEIQQQRLQELKEQQRLEKQIWKECDDFAAEEEVESSQDSCDKNSELRMLLEKPEDGKDDGTDTEKKDVIDISSDEDELMIVHSPATREEDDDEDEEDPNNSGLHVNDTMNQPNWMGQVMVNVGHPPDEPDIYLAPQLAKAVKPHQIGGIRFLYDNMVESMERYKNSNGLGCILAHSMGLGKTIQLVSFIDVVMRHTAMKTVLCIVPINTLQNWVNEFNMWLPCKPVEKPEKKDIILPPPMRVNSTSNLSMMSTSTMEPVLPPPHRVDSTSNLSMASTSTNAALSGFESLDLKAGENQTRNSNVTNQQGELLSNAGSVNINGQQGELISGAGSVHMNGQQGELPLGASSSNLSGLQGEPQSNGAKNGQQTEPDVIYRQFPLHCLNDSYKNMASRAKVVREWSAKGGVLLMGYEMYRLLCSRRVAPARSRKSKKSNEPLIIDIDEEERNKDFLTEIHGALMRPGPDMVVCDEGHRIKNSHAGISQALKNIRTRRRVVLTGYPLQNNLMEYWCMVDFVRPNFLGTKTEFSNMFERPITNGQCVDSTSQDHRLMKFRAHVLHSLLEGFVQRRGHAVLQCALPPKQEYVILVRMSAIQRQLYAFFMQSMMDNRLLLWANNNPLKAFAVCCKIWNHPDVLFKIIKEERKTSGAEDDLDIADDAEGSGKKKGGKGAAKGGSPSRSQSPLPGSGAGSGSEPALLPHFMEKKEVITYDWAQGIMKDYIPGILENGGKMLLLYSLIEESLKLGDKLLIFSQSLFTLNLIEDFLSKLEVPTPGEPTMWARNKNYFRLDGSTSSSEREKLINQFNSKDNDKIHIFLLSTRAGCLGINLVGANRVVVLDASWNPCHDCQAVCRVYRYGQTKPCYIYRLVTDNTMEKKIYDRQINKQGMSDRVVDELQPQNQFSKRQVDNLLNYEDVDLPCVNVKEVEAQYKEQPDPVLLTLIRKHSDWITKVPFTHESLLLDRKDQKLTKAEKRLAKQSYEQEKKLNVSYTRPSYSQFYPQGQGDRYPQGFPGINNRCLQVPNVKRPVASVRPMMSTPHPMHPSQTSQKPGVTVQQIQTTTDITIPGTNSTSTAGRIPAGENVLVIKTPKGVYIRTKEGKIFAVRSGPQGKPTGASRSGPFAAAFSSLGQTSASSLSSAGVSTTSTLGRPPALHGAGSSHSSRNLFSSRSSSKSSGSSSRSELLQSAAALLAQTMPNAANMLTASQPLAANPPQSQSGSDPSKAIPAALDLSKVTPKKKPAPSMERLLADDDTAQNSMSPNPQDSNKPSTLTSFGSNMSLSDMLDFNGEEHNSPSESAMETSNSNNVDMPQPTHENDIHENISEKNKVGSEMSDSGSRSGMTFDDLFDDIMSSPGPNLPTANDLLGDMSDDHKLSNSTNMNDTSSNKSEPRNTKEGMSSYGTNPLEHLASIANSGPSNLGSGGLNPLNNPWASIFGGAPPNTSNMNIPPYPPPSMYSYFPPPYPYMTPGATGAPPNMPNPWGYPPPPPMYMPPGYGMHHGLNPSGVNQHSNPTSSHEKSQPNPDSS